MRALVKNYLIWGVVLSLAIIVVSLATDQEVSYSLEKLSHASSEVFQFGRKLVRQEKDISFQELEHIGDNVWVSNCSQIDIKLDKSNQGFEIRQLLFGQDEESRIRDFLTGRYEQKIPIEFLFVDQTFNDQRTVVRWENFTVRVYVLAREIAPDSNQFWADIQAQSASLFQQVQQRGNQQMVISVDPATMPAMQSSDQPFPLPSDGSLTTVDPVPYGIRMYGDSPCVIDPAQIRSKMRTGLSYINQKYPGKYSEQPKFDVANLPINIVWHANYHSIAETVIWQSKIPFDVRYITVHLSYSEPALIQEAQQHGETVCERLDLVMKHEMAHVLLMAGGDENAGYVADGEPLEVFNPQNPGDSHRKDLLDLEMPMHTEWPMIVMDGQ